MKYIIGLIVTLIIGGVIGWLSRGTEIKKYPVVIHDTIQTKPPEFKPDMSVKFNVDSLTEAINQFWKDSLQELYGRGYFIASGEGLTEYGNYEYQFKSRIPVDPEGQFIFDGNFVLPEIYPPSTVGIFGGVENRFDRNIRLFAGLKYYFIDTRHFQVYGSGEVNYLLQDKRWDGSIKASVELKF
jgi:hypothetical protein